VAAMCTLKHQERQILKASGTAARAEDQTTSSVSCIDDDNDFDEVEEYC
jgi:hypothetical protein